MFWGSHRVYKLLKAVSHYLWSPRDSNWLDSYRWRVSHRRYKPRSRLTSLVFSALRVSSICGRNWTIFSGLLVLGLVPVGTNIVRSNVLGICEICDSRTQVRSKSL